MPEIKQTSFLAGAINDPRSNNPQGFWYSENIEVGNRKSIKQVVNNQAENACNYSVNQCIIKTLEIGGYLWGLGQNDNTDHHTTLWKKTTALTGDWAGVGNGTTSDDFMITVATSIDAKYVSDPFMSYINPDIYFNNGAYLAKYNIGTSTMTAHWAVIPSNGVYGFRGGLQWNGNMYGWYLNKLCKVATDGTITDLSLAISPTQNIVDVIPYENYLAIICTSVTTTEKSMVYLYDGQSVKSYDIGAGDIFGGAYFNGQLIVGMTAKNKRAIYFMGFNGVHFRPIYTYSARANAEATPYALIAGASLMKVFGNHIYFMITGTKPGGTYVGHYEYALARYGTENQENPMAFSIYKTFDFTSARGLDGQTAKNDFLILGNITGTAAIPEAYVAATIYSDTTKTTFFLSSASTFSAQAGVVETFEFTGGDDSIVKQLSAASLAYRPIPTGGSVALKYRVNDGAWTTIFTDNTAGSVAHSAVNIESTGANLDEFNYVKFRVELLGGVELTQIKAKYEELSQENY